MSPEPTLSHETERIAARPPERDQAEQVALAIAWSAVSPGRVGEVALLGDEPAWLGRGEALPDDGGPRLLFGRQRPGSFVPCGPLMEPAVSRRQLRVTLTGDGVEVESVGLCPLLVDGERARHVVVGPGAVLHLEGQLVLSVVARRPMPRLLHWPQDHTGPFGERDLLGLVGESPAMWHLRERLALTARLAPHVLLTGESGTGKELAARAIHGLSSRGSRAAVARNAATLPPSLVDAELFGNVRDYPNPGMRERRGLIGEADGSTLFLDEIGELPEAMQAHLLRVLDAGGEYHRLGEATVRRSDLRLVAATNRDPAELKHDLLARLPLRVELPPLSARLEDVPLLARQLIRDAVRDNPAIAAAADPTVEPELMDALLRHSYTTHVRELSSLLWAALTSSTGRVGVTGEVRERLLLRPSSARTPGGVEPSRDELIAALEAHGGNISRAWSSLGLSSRFALYRLLRKHGLTPERG
ncbi:MAG: hypothetical protein AMXMBFR64_14030 [Myxococcales bacterium]